MEKKELLQTPSQTVGPYFAYGLTPEQYLYDFKSLYNGTMVGNGTDGITIMGKVYDGEGKVISDAMIELWQNEGEKLLIGRYGTGTDRENRFIFKTVKPTSMNGQAPFISVIVLMRGQLLHSYTRLYFEDEPEKNSTDEVLQSIPPERRNTLVARKEKDNVYVFDIYMQGENETVFFAI